MDRLLGHTYIILTLLFTAYSQLVMRWQVSEAGPLPAATSDKVLYIVDLLITPWVLTSIVATLLAGVSWMMALTQFQISYAYPFVSLTYVLVMLGGVFLFGDDLNLYRVAGTGIVLMGILIVARGG